MHKHVPPFWQSPRPLWHYEGLVDIQSPEQIADRLERFIGRTDEAGLRDRYLRHFTREAFGERVRTALLSLEEE